MTIQGTCTRDTTAGVENDKGVVRRSKRRKTGCPDGGRAETATGGWKATLFPFLSPAFRRKRWSCGSGGTSASATMVERDCLRASTRQTGPLASARHPFTHAYLPFPLSPLSLSLFLSISLFSVFVLYFFLLLLLTSLGGTYF